LIEQQTQMRRGTGLIALDRGRAFDGFTLFAPMFGDGTVYLIDLDGNIAHTWRLPYQPGDYGRLLPNGNLFYSAKTPDNDRRFLAWPLFKGGAVLEADWDGNILWEVRHPDHHHDARLTAAGTVLMLTLEKVPLEIAERVQGGTHGPGGDVGMWADRLLEVTKQGEVLWEWHAYEHLDPETDRLTFNDWRDEWSHGNTILETPEGHVLASFRNISTIGIIDKASGQFIWKLGPPTLSQQHDPQVLPNGNVLVFDNGAYRPNVPQTFSRVIEIDPATNDVVWSYRDSPLYNFYSAYISGAQRLPNGNTLICEGCTGRLFEVTSAGEIVWEFISPHFFNIPIVGANNWVFRAFRYSREDVHRWSRGRVG